MKNTLNKSKLGGISWLNPLVGVLFFISAMYVVYYLTISENKLTIILLYILIFTVVIAGIIFLINGITLLRVKKLLLKNNEKITNHIFGSYIFNKEIPLDDLIFNKSLNKFMIDVLIVLTSNNNLYITPTVSYTKQPLIKIPISMVRGMETSRIKIKREKIEGQTLETDIVITSRITTNLIQETLDSKLPIDKIYFNLKTDTSNYKLLLSKKEKSILFMKKIGMQ